MVLRGIMKRGRTRIPDFVTARVGGMTTGTLRDTEATDIRAGSGTIRETPVSIDIIVIFAICSFPNPSVLSDSIRLAEIRRLEPDPPNTVRSPHPHRVRR